MLHWCRGWIPAGPGAPPVPLTLTILKTLTMSCYRPSYSLPWDFSSARVREARAVVSPCPQEQPSANAE